jgi:2-oxoglutarate ferredoxin oxidoreductase subunit alpha
MNRDGQLQQLLTIEYPDLALKILPAQHLDGLPLTAKQVQDMILTKEAKSS